MADTKISALTALTGATIATNDILPIVDTSAVETKGITVTELLTGVLGSTSITGAAVTANAPVVDFAQTWNNAAVTFTGAKLNITNTASNAASLLMDLGTGGGTFVSQFSVRRDGVVNATGSMTAAGVTASSSGLAVLQLSTTASYGVHLARDYVVSWGNNASLNGSLDLILSRRGAANLRLGAADAAAPVAQLLSVQSVVAGTTNTAGTSLTITGSQGTGSGAGGSIIFQVAPAGAAPTVQNALATALTIDSTRLATFSLGASFPGGSSGSLPIQISASNFGLYRGTTQGGQAVIVTCGGTDIFAVGQNSGIGVVNIGPYSWASTIASTADVFLHRDDANKLALKNGANAQEFRVYETTTGTIYKAILGNRGLMKISGAAFADGAGAQAGTLTNAPAIGNPTKWISIDDNGTTRYIPAW